MVDMWSRCANGPKESSDKSETVTNKVKSWWCLDPAMVSLGRD